MGITINNIAKSFGSTKILHDIDLEIKSGELVALLGPSGSGKTSLLRIIAGLEHPDSGQVLFNQQDFTNTHVGKRKVGFVFQHYALFRNMTIFENVAYGLKVRPKKLRPSKEEIKEKVLELLQLVKLENFADRYPNQLSGGQRQRVALARSLAVEPEVLLLDEPFGALDAKVRKELRRWLRHLHNDFQITSVFVTHDQEEALDVADRIVIMNNGRIEQIGTPEEVYNEPVNPFVYDFLGSANVFSGKVRDGHLQTGNYQLEIPEPHDVTDGEGLGYTRPHHFSIEKVASDETSIASTVEHIHAVGPIVRIELKRNDTGEFIELELSKESIEELDVRVGDAIFVKPKELKVFMDFVI
ncbi:sulfate/molybdate ABC transporter ATP-binding protein [Bacillus massiliigorillae]|uniref:sulfate/molybdate ABC transporter ATP-binding protein n=1 Tax=Bacillus massiliigorillae TaxID=1243664 RepID=UPI0003A75026|nr:sulfate/molybdate ABC transporter ATP-binding protein [Bacillus massiliigorillae]